jgi:S1-C subfamily serine protease
LKKTDSKKKRTLPDFSRSSRLSLLGVLLIGVIIFVLFSVGRGDRRDIISGDTSLATIPSTIEEPKNSVAQVVPQGFWDKVARSVVYIEARGSRCGWSGSGSIVLDGSYVLTNQHVSGSGDCALTVFLTESTDNAPSRGLVATLVAFSTVNDLAVLRIFGDDGKPFIDSNHKPIAINKNPLSLGSKLFTLGYPDAGGTTITFTSGDYAGMDDVDGLYYKTTAYMNSGVSGGAGLNELGELVGVPTAGKIDSETNEKLGINLVRPISYALPLLEEAQKSNPQKGAVQIEDSTSVTPDTNDDSQSESQGSGDPIFDTCAEAKSRGYGPYYSGQDHEYDFYQDRDRDGIVCE